MNYQTYLCVDIDRQQIQADKDSNMYSSESLEYRSRSDNVFAGRWTLSLRKER